MARREKNRSRNSHAGMYFSQAFGSADLTSYGIAIKRL